MIKPNLPKFRKNAKISRSRPALGVVLIQHISKGNQLCFQTLHGFSVSGVIKNLCVLLKSDTPTSVPLSVEFENILIFQCARTKSFMLYPARRGKEGSDEKRFWKIKYISQTVLPQAIKIPTW